MIITLTTDFGWQDAFVGIMKGVIAGINPQARVIDLTHGVPAQDIMAAALSLSHAVEYFPPGTIHVAVVDPGVGSKRKPLLIEADGSYFIGPDNGVLSLALERKTPAAIVQLSNPSYRLQPTGNTFHGRDVFAPAAAHLSLGVVPAAFGEPADSFLRLVLPPITRYDGEIRGEIIYIDGFGNLFTNVSERDLTGLSTSALKITVGSLDVKGLVASYAAVGAGEFAAVINSWGLLEIAVFKGDAHRISGAKIGDPVVVRLAG